MATLRQNNPGKTPTICPCCNGWGTVEVALTYPWHRTTIAYADSLCLFCKGRGVMLKAEKLEPIVEPDMNEDLSQMPIDTDVQLKVKVVATGTNVWTVGRKTPDGSIVVQDEKLKQCQVISWQNI